MDYPFFGRLYDRLPERRSFLTAPQPKTFTIPIANSTNNNAASAPASKSKPKNVVTIPVHFVNSDALRLPSVTLEYKAASTTTMDENVAVVKIQAAFRGFSVRKSEPLKNLRSITKTKAEAAEIRRRIGDGEAVELLRRDEKERLKMTEWIMSLLLRLDAIQGVNSFVRESRRAVTRELIILQETVDNIIAGKCMEEMDTKSSKSPLDAEDEFHNVEVNAPVECLQENPNEEIKDHELLDQLKEEAPMNGTEADLNEVQEEESLPSQMHGLQIECSNENKYNNGGLDKFDEGFSDARQTVSEPEECTTSEGGSEDADTGDLKENNFVDQVVEADTSHDTEIDLLAKNSGDGEISAEAQDPLEAEIIQTRRKLEADDNMGCEEVAVLDEAGDSVPKKVESVEETSMVREENEMLKKTVADLLKKSEIQSDLINNLSVRIAQLEEDVSWFSSRRRKKGDGKKTREGSNNFPGGLTWDENENTTTPTFTDERTAQPQDGRRRRRKTDRHMNGLMEDWF